MDRAQHPRLGAPVGPTLAIGAHVARPGLPRVAVEHSHVRMFGRKRAHGVIDRRAKRQAKLIEPNPVDVRGMALKECGGLL